MIDSLRYVNLSGQCTNLFNTDMIQVCQIVDGVEYLHTLDPPVTHKDIKGVRSTRSRLELFLKPRLG